MDPVAAPTPGMPNMSMSHAAIPDFEMASMTQGECRPSVMLWNWHTIDTCLLSKNWHITSSGMFAGSCIAVVLLTMSLELIRRTAKEYDRKILKAHQERVALLCDVDSEGLTGNARRSKSSGSLEALKRRTQDLLVAGSEPGRFRPHLVQQIVRALLHTLQFTVAYMIMLLAMYYNGYIILSIIVGAFLGFVVFEWEWIDCVGTSVGPKEEATSCCG